MTLAQAEQRALLGRLHLEHVEGGAADVARLEGRGQRALVDQAAARAVDDAHALLGLGQRGGVDDVAGPVGERGVQRDEIGAAQQVVELDLLHAQLHGALGREEGIEGDHLHLEADGAVGDDGADVAAADHAQRLGVELDAQELRLLPLAGLGGAVGLGDLAGERHHQRDGVLGGGDGIAEGRVHDDDALGGGGPDVDVVDADAGAADHLQLGGGGDDLLGGLGGGADGEAVVVADDLLQLVLGEPDLHVGVDAALLEDVDGGGRELVGDEDAGRGHGAFSDGEGGIPISPLYSGERERPCGYAALARPALASAKAQSSQRVSASQVGRLDGGAAPDAQMRRRIAVAGDVARGVLLVEDRLELLDEGALRIDRAAWRPPDR